MNRLRFLWKAGFKCIGMSHGVSLGEIEWSERLQIITVGVQFVCVRVEFSVKSEDVDWFVGLEYEMSILEEIS